MLPVQSNKQVPGCPRVPVTQPITSLPTWRRANMAASLMLAILATATSLGISVLSGWQRGGTLNEQVASVALAVVAVLGAHLLPALGRGMPRIVHRAAVVLCMASCMVVLYGQVEFFLLAQRHAGSRRADATGQPASPPILAMPATNRLTSIAQEEETIRDAMAGIEARRCDRNCPSLHWRHELLSAKLSTLTTEADEVKRQEGEHDRQVMLADRAARMRDSLRNDPATARLSAVTGLDAENLNLLLALVCAAVLDFTGSFSWYLAFEPGRISAVAETGSVVSQGEPSRDEPVHASPELVADTGGIATEATDDRLTQLMHDVAAGKVRPTVEAIRTHFRCSQKDANQLRRQFHALREALQPAALN